ncbi:uncharacterized protein LOC144922926 [Branchiostoma floridae x Branchiostoma belcheri]
MATYTSHVNITLRAPAQNQTDGSDVAEDDDDVIFLEAVDNTKQMGEVSTPEELPEKTRNPSVIILGTPEKKTRCVSVAGSPGQEGLLVTYSRLGDTANYPHPRSACPHHPFSVTEPCNVAGRRPNQQNAAHCEKCYCFACDKPAKQCTFWTAQYVAHCNAYKQSSFWKGMRRALNKVT